MARPNKVKFLCLLACVKANLSDQREREKKRESVLQSLPLSAAHITHLPLSLAVHGHRRAERVLGVVADLRPLGVAWRRRAEAARAAAAERAARRHARDGVDAVGVLAQRHLLRLVEQRVGEVGALDVGAREVGAREDDALQDRALQVGLVDDGAVEERVAQVGALKVGLGFFVFCCLLLCCACCVC